MSLVDRGLLAAAGTKICAAEGAFGKARSELEQKVVRQFNPSAEASSLFKMKEAEPEMRRYEHELTRLGLLPDDEQKEARLLRMAVAPPRYGFYLDHVLDAFGSVFVFAGLALSGYMSERIAVGLLVAYLLLSIEVYLTTHTIGTFHLSFAAFSPTELRLLLIAGNIALLYKPLVQLAGKEYLLSDVGGAIGIVGLGTAAVWSAVKHGMFLYRTERLS
jgi:hypothetical protein